MDYKQIGKIGTIVVAVGTSLGEVVRRILRRKGQKELQKRVDETAPTPVIMDASISDEVQITIADESDIDLTEYQEVLMSDEESNEWKSLISTLSGETVKTAMTTSAFNGLLKCDVPLRDLCRAKDNPVAMRGIIINDGKISKQASFSEAGIDNASPLLAYQLMATITSQYYQQVMLERLNSIDAKIGNIIEILEADDRAKLKVAYNRFVELSKKSTYDIADKQILSEFSGYVEIVSEKYKELLSKINSLNVEYKWSDKEEAELKIHKLQESHYFEYLEMAMQADSLTFIASVISVKVARYLNNEEDAKIYADRINLDYWNNYVGQFCALKHDVIKYLELEAESSWIQGKAIKSLKSEQEKKFDSVKTLMLNLQRQFDYNTTLFIKVQDDGSIKKFMTFSTI